MCKYVVCSECDENIYEGALITEYVVIADEVICKSCLEHQALNMNSKLYEDICEEREDCKCDKCSRDLKDENKIYEIGDLIACEYCIEGEIHEF